MQFLQIHFLTLMNLTGMKLTKSSTAKKYEFRLSRHQLFLSSILLFKNWFSSTLDNMEKRKTNTFLMTPPCFSSCWFQAHTEIFLGHAAIMPLEKFWSQRENVQHSSEKVGLIGCENICIHTYMFTFAIGNSFFGIQTGLPKCPQGRGHSWC